MFNIFIFCSFSVSKYMLPMVLQTTKQCKVLQQLFTEVNLTVSASSNGMASSNSIDQNLYSKYIKKAWCNTCTHACMHTRMHTHTYIHTQLFYGPFGDIEWQWHQLGHMRICTLTQTHNHASILPLGILQTGCWHGYESRSMCRFAYGPADATATHYLLLQ